MARELITDFSEFSPKTVTYGEPRMNARGGKSIKIMDARKNKLILSTPIMLTWGINKMVDEDTGKVSYTASLQFPSQDYANDDTTLFFNKMKEFEDNLLSDCVKNGKEWFSKPKLSREVAEALYTPVLKYPKDKATGEPDYSRSPTIRVKIPYWEGKFNTELYDMNENLIFDSTNAEEVLENVSFETLIPKTSHILACMQCNGIWFAGGKFGVTWQLVQAMIRKPVRIQGGCFLRPKSSDLKQLDSIAQKEAEHNSDVDDDDEIHSQDDIEEHQPKKEQPVIVEDSDDEPEKEAEPEPEPEKKAPVKRKVVRKIKKKD
jgi:hypothetical protein